MRVCETADELVGATVHDTIRNELVKIDRVVTDGVVAIGEDGDERRIRVLGIGGLRSSRYVVKEKAST